MTRLLAFLILSTSTVHAAEMTNTLNSNSFCNDTLSCLQNIAQTSSNLLRSVNTLPAYIESASQYFLSWLSADTSEGTKTLQAVFTQTGNQFIYNHNFMNQSDNLNQLTADALGGVALGITPQIFSSDGSKSPRILSILTNPKDTANPAYSVNDIAYSSVLGLPPVIKNAPTSPQQAAYNYLKNASGMTIPHLIPMADTAWGGSAFNKMKYRSYYNTVMATTTFNAYALDHLLAENANGNALNPQQLNLIAQATSGNWFTTVASENIGVVLRQILMFQSQTYVLLAQSLQTQKQLLTAQVMNNSLLIAANQATESMMAARAQNIPLS